MVNDQQLLVKSCSTLLQDAHKYAPARIVLLFVHVCVIFVAAVAVIVGVVVVVVISCCSYSGMIKPCLADCVSIFGFSCVFVRSRTFPCVLRITKYEAPCVSVCFRAFPFS